MKSAIDRLAEDYPDAKFCVMAIMPIAEDASASIYKGTAANERIREYNSMLLKTACRTLILTGFSPMKTGVSQADTQATVFIFTPNTTRN